MGRKWNGFVSHEVPFPATRNQRSRVAGNGTECEVKTIELSSPTSGGEQWAFPNFIIFIAVKKTVPKLRKQNLLVEFHTKEVPVPAWSLVETNLDTWLVILSILTNCFWSFLVAANIHLLSSLSYIASDYLSHLHCVAKLFLERFRDKHLLLTKLPTVAVTTSGPPTSSR